MATATTTEQRMASRVDEDQDEQQQHEQLSREVSRRVSRLAVEGGADSKLVPSEGVRAAGGKKQLPADAAARGRALLPPPHAWLAIKDDGAASARRRQYGDSDGPADAGEQWARVLRGAGGHPWGGARQQQRRSSFSVVRRERAAREAWLDRAWEMKRSWHERNGGAPDADTPVVVVVGKATASGGGAASPRAAAAADHHHHQMGAGAVGVGGVAMDVEEVRACRDLGLELPADCTVEIQCYGLSGGGGSPTHAVSGGGTDSPCAVSSPGADPMDVKARLKVWAQAVALASTTHLTS